MTFLEVLLLDNSSQYKGYKKLWLTDNELEVLYSKKEIPNTSFYENEYLILLDFETQEPIGYFCQKNGKLERVNFPVFDNIYNGQIKPRNPEQYCAMDLLKNNEVPLKLLLGCFGAGKDLLCINAALELIQKNAFKKIIYVRNNVQVKDTDPIGALPGDLMEKTMWQVMPIADHCGGIDGIENLMRNDQLEVIPLAHLRGRSIRNSIIYVTEAENLTKQHIQLIIGRVDEGSSLWFNGDLKQRDKINFEKSQGLEKMIDSLKGDPLFGYVFLEKSERSKVARLADKLD